MSLWPKDRKLDEAITLVGVGHSMDAIMQKMRKLVGISSYSPDRGAALKKMLELRANQLLDLASRIKTNKKAKTKWHGIRAY